MLGRRKVVRKNVDFLLQNSHYKKLHLYLYFFTLIVILAIYFIIVLIFKDSSIVVITMGIISLLVGIYSVFKRDEIVKKISEKLDSNKKKKMKKDDKYGLKSTLRRITPRNKKLKFNIKNKTTLKEKIDNFKSKFKPEEKDPKKKKPDYIELE